MTSAEPSTSYPLEGEAAVEAVRACLGGPAEPRGLDDTVVDYCVAVLADADFEFGRGGAGCADVLAPVAADAGFFGGDLAAARAAFVRLAYDLRGPAELDAASDDVDDEGGRGEGGGGKRGKKTAFRRLDAGRAFRLGDDEADGRGLLVDARRGGGGARTQLDGDWTAGTSKDRAKIQKRQEKEERLALAGLERHLAQAEKVEEADRPTLVRAGAGAGGARDVQLDRVSVSNGGANLIEDATITLAAGRRYGMVGRNGTGKTTFLRALAGRAVEGLPAALTILHVAQEARGDAMSALEAVLSCDVERTELLEREAELLAAAEAEEEAMANQLPTAAASSTAATVGSGDTGANDGARPATSVSAVEALAAVHARMEAIDAPDAPARAARVLSGLQFTDEMMAQPTSTFSGGWRMRVALAQALFCQPDLLLLDEPTNHLDLHAVLWLEDYLLRWPGTVVVVSHAREFLNVVCTDIVHLHNTKLTQYKGNFSEFMATRAERNQNQAKAAEAQKRRIAEMSKFVETFRFNAKRASLVQSRVKAMNKMTVVDVEAADEEVEFRFPDADAGLQARGREEERERGQGWAALAGRAFRRPLTPLQPPPPPGPALRQRKQNFNAFPWR